MIDGRKKEKEMESEMYASGAGGKAAESKREG